MLHEVVFRAFPQFMARGLKKHGFRVMLFVLLVS